MKKISILAALMLTLAFSACTKTDDTVVPTDGDTTDVSDTTDSTDATDGIDNNTTSSGTNTSTTTRGSSSVTKVTYLSTAKPLSKVLDSRKQAILDQYNSNMSGWTAKWSDISDLFFFSEIGKFNNGKYADWKLVLLELNCEGPCFKTDFYRFAYNTETDELINLSKNSEPRSKYSPNYLNPFFKNVDSKTVINELIPPQVLTTPDNHDYYLSQQDSHFNYTPSGTVAYTDATYGKVYLDDNSGCLYIQTPDGVFQRYEYNPGFVSGNINNRNVQVKANWNDGSKTTITDNYSFASSSCGIDGACFLLLDLDPSILTQTGTASSGDKLYELKNPVEDLEADEYDRVNAQKLTAAGYKNVQMNAQYSEPPRTAPSFNDWIKTHPVIFFQDPFGRWSYLMDNNSKPPAECGKPVIYLYPQKTIDVNVQVLIDKFTKTIPSYGPQGWTVKAQPNGELYNYADGQTYPYLFWEGNKNGVLSPTEGTVVARKDLKKFLSKSLTKMGLNKQERTDFMEYWYHNMLDNFKEPYFYITWVGTKDFNKVAPLEITPKPDTLIRVFMHYEPLSYKFKAKGQKLSKIPRRGFTVVEWGGSPMPWTE